MKLHQATHQDFEKVKNAYILRFSWCQMIEIEKKVVALRSKSATYTKYVRL